MYPPFERYMGYNQLLTVTVLSPKSKGPTVVAQICDTACPKLCAVEEESLEIPKLATEPVVKDPNDPFWVFQAGEGTTIYLVGDLLIKYYHYITCVIFPSTSEKELRLFSCHPICVKVAMLLNEAENDNTYIKQRPCWLNDCRQVYLRDTMRICAEHKTVLEDANDIILEALVLSESNTLKCVAHAEDGTDR